jgi:hypothetical protein
MKKINRLVNYFKYGINPHKDYEVKAYNERGRHVKILVTELATLQTPLNYYLLYIQGPNGSQLEAFEREGSQTELFFNISDIQDGEYTCAVFASNDTKYPAKDTPLHDITFDLGSDTDFQQVQLGRAGFEQTGDEIFWDAIKERQLDFNSYFNFINKILYLSTSEFNDNKRKHIVNQGPFVGVREYNLLKYGTAFFMLKKSALQLNEVKSYLGNDNILPYYENLSDAYEEAAKEYPKVTNRNHPTNDDQKLVIERFENPFFIELIWSYWMEQGMLMQGMNLINFRFQNINAGNLGQIGRFDLSPLRGLSHILWGFIQDEQHRLSLPRRIQEYDHEYGLMLNGKAVQPFISADSRSKFIEAFHNLLTKTSIFYKEADDTTRIADAFPILNSLKEVHLLLAEGNHNAYGNLTWTARHEMMMTQYIFARDEVRQFLGGRPMVPYPERWMDRLDAVRSIMNWGNTSITYFYDLAIHGEKILLAIRYGNWSDAHMPVASAANWAMSFRDSVQKYIHAYQTVTGVDLSADAMGNNVPKNIQPSILIQRRVLEERSRVRRA